MSRRRYQKGLQKEINCSRKIHSHAIPVLIEPRVLRAMSCGQIDLAGIGREGPWRVLTIYEVKSVIHLSMSQRSRLVASATYLSEIFDMPCRISVI